MGFFNNILEKLGLKKDKDEEEKAADAAAPAASKPAAAAKPAATVAKPAAPAMTSKERDDAIKSALPPKQISEVDVVSKLEGLAAGKDLNWKVSIVDLLKLLDIDSSREAREELAKELNAPADVTGDSARLNVWLHKTVLKKISENGGNIPASLLD